MVDVEGLKAEAAERALTLVRPGMVIGLGTGSTARYFIEGLGRLVRQGTRVRAVATSHATAELAATVGIASSDDLDAPIDLVVDGADEIDPRLRLIKGRGGALTREKLVAVAGRKVVIVADDSKLVEQLGRGPLPVEVLPFLWHLTARRLEQLGASYNPRGEPSDPFVTDNGNLILDLSFAGGIADPEALDIELKRTPGVVEHGLFLGLAHACIIAGVDGVHVMGSLD